MTAFAHGREPFPASPNKKRAHDAEPSGRTADKESPLPAPDNLPDRAEVLEAADHGRRLEPAMWTAVQGLAPATEVKPLDPALAALLVKDIAPMREQTLQDMVMLDANLDQSGAAELHMLAASVCATLDEMAAVLRREIGS